MIGLMKISCNLSIFIIMIVLSMVYPTLSQGTPKTTTKSNSPDVEVDEYLMQEIGGDQILDYSVTELDHQKILTLAWWVTQTSRATTTYGTTKRYPIFKLMPNISSLAPDEKEALLKNPILLNSTVEQHIIYLYGYPKTDEYYDMKQKITTALYNDIEVAHLFSERDAKRSSLALLTADNLTTFTPVDEYYSMALDTSINMVKDTQEITTVDTTITTSETTRINPSDSLVRQQMQNEQAILTATTTMPTVTATMEPRFMNPDVLVEHDPAKIHDDVVFSKVTTTMSPLLINIKENMLKLNNGPFSGFLHGFLGVLALKDHDRSKEIYLALDRVIGANANAKKYDEPMGYDVGLVLKRGTELLNSYSADTIAFLANMLKDLIEVRSVELDRETAQLIDELDLFYNTKEADALMNSILPIYEYPKDRSSDDVARELEDCVFKPFMNTPPAQLERKALIMELLIKLLEKNDFLSTLRANCKGPDCSKIKTKVSVQVQRRHSDKTYMYRRRKNFIESKTNDWTGSKFSRLGSRYHLNKTFKTPSDTRSKDYYKNRGTTRYSSFKYIRKNRKHNAFSIKTENRLKTQTEVQPRHRNANKPTRNRTWHKNYNPNPYARKKKHKPLYVHKRLNILQPSKAMPSRYLTPKYDFTHRKTQKKKYKFNLRQIDDTKRFKESSYSDDEEDLKFNLQDALRHPHPIVSNNTEHLSGQIRDGRRMGLRNKTILDESSYSDEEETIKTNIYKILTNKNNNKR